MTENVEVTQKIYVMSGIDDGDRKSLGVEGMVGNYPKGRLDNELKKKLREAPSVELGNPSESEFPVKVGDYIARTKTVDSTLINLVEDLAEKSDGFHEEVIQFLKRHEGEEVFVAPEPK